MSIASGSSGNAAYAGSDHTHILIDSGISRKRILEGLKRLDLSPDDISAILITHEHADHISSLALMERLREIPVYTTQGTVSAILDKCVPGEKYSGSFREMAEKGLFHIVAPRTPFTIGDITATALPVSHDAAEPVCYTLSCGSKKCGIVTDLGCFDGDLAADLQGINALLLEANHDIRMLETGPYPYMLKRRIAGSRGHLSNESAGQFLSGLLHDRMQHIALGHLSKKNNYSELARLTVMNAIDEGSSPYHSGDFRIDIADPVTGTGVYEI